MALRRPEKGEVSAAGFRATKCDAEERLRSALGLRGGKGGEASLRNTAPIVGSTFAFFIRYFWSRRSAVGDSTRWLIALFCAFPFCFLSSSFASCLSLLRSLMVAKKATEPPAQRGLLATISGGQAKKRSGFLDRWFCSGRSFTKYG